MSWTFGLCQLDGTSIGEIRNAYERRLTIPLNGLPTASVRLRLDDELADAIADLDGACLLKIYQGTTLRFIGDLVTAEEATEGEGSATMLCNFAGPLWRLQKRLLGTGFDGAGYSASGTAANTILTNILNTANTSVMTTTPASYDTGIRVGTFDTLYRTAVGPWRMKPIAEALTEMQAAKIPFPVDSPPTASRTVQDTFSTGVHGSAIDGRTDDLGNTWDSNGSGPDWVLQATQGLAYRTSSSDGGARWCLTNAAAHTAVLVGMDQGSTERSALNNYVNFHLYARISGHTAATAESGNWVRVVVDYDTENGTIVLQKQVSGMLTTISTYSYSYTWLEAGVMYAVRLLIDADGNYSVWHYLPASWPSPPVIQGRDAAMATGGALDDGIMGWGDINVSGINTQRSFDNIFAATFTGPQSFDFQIAPSEPTADATGVKIGTLDVRTAIGTSKPNVVFEYGTGNRSIKSYRRILSREGLLNQAWALSSEFPDPPSGANYPDIRTATDRTAITANKGVYEEVIPQDLADGQLRQALVDAHVLVRKQAREVITFQPSETAPEVFTDYIVGDTVTARAVHEDVVRFNGTFRIYGVEISVDDEGKATVVPTLTPE